MKYGLNISNRSQICMHKRKTQIKLNAENEKLTDG